MNPCDFRILICGCFDLFHVGHLQLLQGAHQFGKVYVRIGDDVSIRKKKGEGRPVIPEAERLQIVSACKYVFNADIFSFHPDPVAAHKELLEKIQPDAYAEGPDHRNTSIYPLLEKMQIPRIIIPQKIQGTTSIVSKSKKIEDVAQEPPHYVDRDQPGYYFDRDDERWHASSEF